MFYLALMLAYVSFRCLYLSHLILRALCDVEARKLTSDQEVVKSSYTENSIHKLSKFSISCGYDWKLTSKKLETVKIFVRTHQCLDSRSHFASRFISKTSRGELPGTCYCKNMDKSLYLSAHMDLLFFDKKLNRLGIRLASIVVGIRSWIKIYGPGLSQTDSDFCPQWRLENFPISFLTKCLG